ncbi:hypothetical protein RvY_05038-3 [Ramazzottius varieornatus]|nr:hypothetical protein RvY_05038-3 [Ramazzottius varieornatus]
MMEEIETSAQNSPNQKTVIVQGYSMWYSYWNPENSVQNFIVDLEKALPVMNKLADITCYIWMPQPPLNLNKQVKWLTQMLDSQMSEINEVARKRLHTDIVYWEGSRNNAAADDDDYYDFAHPGYRILLQDWYDLYEAFGCSQG